MRRQRRRSSADDRFEACAPSQYIVDQQQLIFALSDEDQVIDACTRTVRLCWSIPVYDEGSDRNVGRTDAVYSRISWTAIPTAHRAPDSPGKSA